MRKQSITAQADLDAGFPIVYCDEHYPETMEDNNLMIEEHPNGDRFIISINMDTREITTIRPIPSREERE